MLKTHIVLAGSGETVYLNTNKDPELETICRKVSAVAFKLKEGTFTNDADVVGTHPPRVQPEPHVPSSPKCSHVWSAPLTLRVT